MDFLHSFLLHWSYFGLFGLLVLGIVGLPIPDETLLVLSGYLTGQHQLQLPLTFLAGGAGAICGITGSYLIGRTLGQTAVLRYGRYLHLTPERLGQVHQWFERFGNWLLTFGYFVPGVRHFTALVAGLSGTEYSTFALFAYPGALVWVTTFVLIGRAVGEHWQEALTLVHHYTLLATAIGAGLLALVLLGARALRRKHGR